MSRGTKAPFRAYEGEKTKDIHVRLTKSMLTNKNFIELSSSAKVIYIYMKLWAMGREEVDYSKSLGSNILSPSTVLKAIRELIERGFIERTYFSNGGGHKSNRYKFSSKWINMRK